MIILLFLKKILLATFTIQLQSHKSFFNCSVMWIIFITRFYTSELNFSLCDFLLVDLRGIWKQNSIVIYLPVYQTFSNKVTYFDLTHCFSLQRKMKTLQQFLHHFLRCFIMHASDEFFFCCCCCFSHFPTKSRNVHAFRLFVCLWTI